MTYTENSSMDEEYQETPAQTEADLMKQESKKGAGAILSHDLPLDSDYYGDISAPEYPAHFQEDTLSSSILSSTYITSGVRKKTYRLVTK